MIIVFTILNVYKKKRLEYLFSRPDALKSFRFLSRTSLGYLLRSRGQANCDQHAL